MSRSKNIRGFTKTLFNLRVKLGVFFHFVPRLLTGRMSLRQFFQFLRRLLFFLGKLQENKFVKIDGYTRPGLYIPGYPSKAFFTACGKFAVFGEKLPGTTALISITSACRFRCVHCYQKNDKGKDVSIEALVGAAKELQNMGVSFFNIEGGEPFLTYERLLAVCRALDDRSEIWINSTGDGMTVEKLNELKAEGLTAVMFSLHSANPETVNSFMGKDNAWEKMIEGAAMCRETGIAVAFNTCLSKDDFFNGNFEAVMDRARELEGVIIQVIKPKPAGGWLDGGAELFSEEDLNAIKEKVHTYNHDRMYSDYPAISAHIMEEDADMFGCTAGGTDRFYINAKGDVQPCEFLNISFGNIAEEEFAVIYKRMRSHFEEPGECWLCEKYSSQIGEIFKEKQFDSLPLNKEDTETIIQNWDRGKPTHLYRKIEHDLD